MALGGGKALGPSELFIPVPRPSGDFAITKLSFDLVDAEGMPVDASMAHLHHFVITNRSRPNPACPDGTFGLPGQIVGAAGAERTVLQTGDPYGVVVKGSDQWTGVYELMSRSIGRPAGVPELRHRLPARCRERAARHQLLRIGHRVQHLHLDARRIRHPRRAEPLHHRGQAGPAHRRWRSPPQRRHVRGSHQRPRPSAVPVRDHLRHRAGGDGPGHGSQPTRQRHGHRDHGGQRRPVRRRPTGVLRRRPGDRSDLELPACRAALGWRAAALRRRLRERPPPLGRDGHLHRLRLGRRRTGWPGPGRRHRSPGSPSYTG